LETSYIINVTVVATMQDFLTIEDFTVESLAFTWISDRRFSIDRYTGAVKIMQPLDPLRTHYPRVYLTYNGTISSTNKFYGASTSALLRIFTSGE